VSGSPALASGWSIQQAPAPPGAVQTELARVSCASPRACTAVGVSWLPTTEKALVERWNGRNWSIQRQSRHVVGLGDVSCASPTACTAVGDSTLARTLAERWAGGRWAIQQTPDQGALVAVSCPSLTACMAMGYQAEQWDGEMWTKVSVRSPAGANSRNLYGVSCAAVAACTAIGNYDNGAGKLFPLAERWNGERWAIEATPTPMGATRTELVSVSCPSASSCVAVGSSLGSQQTAFVERWNGRKWRIERISAPVGSSLSSVSCATARACTAIGSYLGPTGGFMALVERWNGKTWSIQPTPVPAGAELLSVSCASPRTCTLVGKHTANDFVGPSPLVERWTR
jgi:hypothetical protein